MDDEESLITVRETAEGLGLAWMAYTGPLAFIALMVDRDNRFVVHHVGQGFALFVASAAAGLGIVIAFIPDMFAALALSGFAGKLGPVGVTVSVAFTLFVLGSVAGYLAVSWLLTMLAANAGVRNALSGKLWLIPGIGGIGVRMGLSLASWRSETEEDRDRPHPKNLEEEEPGPG